MEYLDGKIARRGVGSMTCRRGDKLMVDETREEDTMTKQGDAAPVRACDGGPGNCGTCGRKADCDDAFGKMGRDAGTQVKPAAPPSPEPAVNECGTCANEHTLWYEAPCRGCVDSHEMVPPNWTPRPGLPPTGGTCEPKCDAEVWTCGDCTEERRKYCDISVKVPTDCPKHEAGEGKG